MINISVNFISEHLIRQAKSLEKAAEKLHPTQVSNAVDILISCIGKVVLLGVGKSGLISRKIAATLTSVGTPAISLHPSDALHGDIGIITSGDVVIILSNSGETDELLAILPHVKLRQIPIIAILGNLQSSLAYQSDVVLDASVDCEACPLNLAPTTSTTVALAIGDALAMTVMQLKGITSSDFALNHPAGRLGKRLTLKVADLMHSGQEVPTLAPTAPWLEVVLAIGQGGLGAVSIVDDQSYLLGLITDGDIRRAIGSNTDPSDLQTLTAATIMTRKPVVVTPDTLAFDALKLMEERESQIAVLPVVDAEYRSLGLIRLHDIIRSGL